MSAAGRVEVQVAAELVGQRIHGGEAGTRAGDLGDGDGPVEGDDRRWRHGEELVVQRQHLGPVGVHRGGCIAVHGVDRRLDLVRPRCVASQTGAHEVLALGDQSAIPQAAVLVGQQHQRAVGGDTSGPSRLTEQQQREQADRLALVGHQLDEHPSETDRLDTEIGADERVPTGRCVALVEHEVDDGEHGVEPIGKLGVVGYPVGMLAALIFFFARTSRWAIVDSGTRNARAISSVCSPPSRRNVRAICELDASAG